MPEKLHTIPPSTPGPPIKAYTVSRLGRKVKFSDELRKKLGSSPSPCSSHMQPYAAFFGAKAWRFYIGFCDSPYIRGGGGSKCAKRGWQGEGGKNGELLQLTLKVLPQLNTKSDQKKKVQNTIVGANIVRGKSANGGGGRLMVCRGGEPADNPQIGCFHRIRYTLASV